MFVLFSKIMSSFMRLLSLHGRLEYSDGSIICIFMKMNSWYVVSGDGIYSVYSVCAQQDFFILLIFYNSVH